jgi:hypothetical protein
LCAIPGTLPAFTTTKVAASVRLPRRHRLDGKSTLHRLENGQGKMSDMDLLWDIQAKIEGNTICPLGDAAAWPVASAIRHFREEFEWHVKEPASGHVKQLRPGLKGVFEAATSLEPVAFMPKVTIDGFEIEVPEGTTILNAARMIGGDIVPPAMCYYSTLKTSGGKLPHLPREGDQGLEKTRAPCPSSVASCQHHGDGRHGSGQHHVSRSAGTPAKAWWSSCSSTTRSIARSATRPANATCRTCPTSTAWPLTRYEFERRTFEKIDIGPYISCT